MESNSDEKAEAFIWTQYEEQIDGRWFHNWGLFRRVIPLNERYPDPTDEIYQVYYKKVFLEDFKDNPPNKNSHGNLVRNIRFSEVTSIDFYLDE